MIKKILLFLGLYSYALSGNLINMLPYKTAAFSPVLKQTFTIPFSLEEEANVSIDIYTPDHNLIRSLEGKSLTKGVHALVWDGKDNNATFVPDEAYITVITASTKTQKEIIDHRFTGGVILKNLHTKVDKSGNISYYLSESARVLVRAGIKNGSMLRSISHWVPKNKGKIRQRWNMKDKKKLIDIAALDFVVSVSAYTLPAFSIITTNNKSITYKDYFIQKQFKCAHTIENAQHSKIDKQKRSKHSMQCRIEDSNPDIKMEIANVQHNDKNITILKIGEGVNIKISMSPEDEVRFAKEKYEVSFFVDHEFISEEESGYMPLAWHYTPNGLKKGEHILTVNVTSFSGKVGVIHYKFVIE